MADSLTGFETTSFTHDGTARAVFRIGKGPGVIVIEEMPGITPEVAAFARRLADVGFTAVVPHLFGAPGAPPNVLSSVLTPAWACVSREFATWLTGRTSPVIDWLRALARSVHGELGGPGVGAVGMCFTGGFALGMMVDPVVAAPVLSQPSLPFPLTRAHRRDLNLDAADLSRVKERVADGACVLGFRFSHDRISPRERFERLRDELGDGFIGVEIDSGPGNRHGFSTTAHSVFTHEFRDEPGHPTRDAFHQLLEFFRERLSA